MSSVQLPAGRLRPLRSQSSQQVLKPTQGDRKQSESSDSSSSSQVTMLSSARPVLSPYVQPAVAASTTSVNNISRMTLPPRVSSKEAGIRQTSQTVVSSDYQRHRAPQHSQGFFEPSLRTTSYNTTPSSSLFSASAIAAQAAMQVQAPQYIRHRSQTIPDPAPANQPTGRRKPSAPVSVQSGPPPAASGITPQVRGLPSSGSRVAASSTAKEAYPRSPLSSPDPPYLESTYSNNSISSPEKESKPGKEKSRMKIFSKPKSLNIAKDKDGGRRGGALSPNKMGIYGPGPMARAGNQSTTSLADSTLSGASSMYSSANNSTSTLIPSDRSIGGAEKEKEKHRHHFLSRQKHKHGNDHFNLPLSSASSNSRPADPNAPQSLYSFAPSSPGPSSSFNKSISGLDLRHGGRALREKKREEKDSGLREGTNQLSLISSVDTMAGSTLGPPSNTSTFAPDMQSLASFGLHSMAPDDVWPLLKARILVIFEGEDPRTPVEDFNRLVTTNLQYCINQRAPSVIIEDLRELLQIGFLSLNQTLQRIPDDRLVPHLVDMWSSVFGTVLPFMQAVFHPLDLEFKGRGTLMSSREAADFWGDLPIFSRSPLTPGFKGPTGFNGFKTPKAQISHVPLGEALDVRTLVLLAFRDTVILPRHDNLLNIFSRLSIESINGYSGLLDRVTSPHLLAMRPGTAASSGSGGNSDPHGASYNSQSSTLLDSSTVGSLGTRSRATSNTSAGSFHSVFAQRPQPASFNNTRMQMQQPLPPSMDSAKVTQTAARMLQCMSILAGLQAPGTITPTSNAAAGAVPGDPSTEESGEGEQEGDGADAELIARKKIERLAKDLKLNWLGRGRTGRNRRGLVGTKVKSPSVGLGVTVGA